MPEYAHISGFVQFEPIERELDDGGKVRDISVRGAGVEQPLVRVTLWPQFEDVEVEEGDFVAIDGTYEERVGQKKDGGKTTFRNMNARRVFVAKGEQPAERTVANAGGGRKNRSF